MSRFAPLLRLGLAGLVGLLISPALLAAGISATHKYAWSENTGWLNFNATNGNVQVYADHLEGYVWAENIGWIRLGSYTGGGAHTYANTSNTTYGVNHNGAGGLSGYAWSENTGWINFKTSQSQVTIDATGVFDGFAWGENVGYIHFRNASPAYQVAVNRDPQTITNFNPPATGTVGGSATLGATGGGSGNPVTFGATPSAVCTISGATVSFNATGTCTVTANQTGNALYLPATASRGITVSNLNTYAITTTANPVGGGTVNCIPNPVPHGSGSNCTANANVGYTFANWSGDCTGASCALTNVTSAKTVTANFAVKTFTGPAAPGTGNATATVSGGGDTCGFTSNTQFVAVASVPVAPPAGYHFPHGLFDFTLTSCEPDGTVTLTITYPSALPTGTVYWKYGPTPDNAVPHWYRMPTAIAGKTATFTITNGRLGDDDLTANRDIVDQGGPGVPDFVDGATGIPTLSEWALWLMSLLLGLSVWRLWRREPF